MSSEKNNSLSGTIKISRAKIDLIKHRFIRPMFAAAVIAALFSQFQFANAQEPNRDDKSANPVTKEEIKPVAADSINFIEQANREAAAGRATEEPTVAPFMTIEPPVAAADFLRPPPGLSLFETKPTNSLVPSPGASVSFQALPDNNSTIPPDTHGAVGPNHVMTVLNSEIRIQSKTGTVISTMTLNAFWAGVEPAGGGGVFDPKVLYDQINGRWIFTAVSDAQIANSAFLIAATPGNDPTAVWNRFAVDYDSTNVDWGDYPSFGFNKDLVAVNLNSFSIAANTFTGTRTFILRKSTLYAAVPTITGTTFNNGTAFGFTIVPAITHDNALATLYFLADRTAAGFPGQLQLYTATTTGAAETFTASAITPTGTAWNFNSPTDFALQSGVARGIMNNDSRIQNVVYRNGSLWTAHTAFFPTGTPTRSTVQWWQINPASNTPVQLGRVEDTTPPNLGGTAVIFYAFPSIAVNQNSSVLIGYSRFSSLQFASANYSFRSAGDPLNTMRDDTVLKAGEDCYNKDFGGGRNRWGDYSSTVIDPSDDSSFWTIQEYAAPRVGALCTTANSGRWATWWGKILAPTAALTPVGGRVMTAHKRSINGVRLTFTNQQGIGRTVRTNPAGYYRLDDLAAGETYIVSLYHKSYRFETQVFSLNEELTEFNFVALP